MSRLVCVIGSLIALIVSRLRSIESCMFDNEITNWVKYFIRLVAQAQDDAQDQINFVIQKARFFDKYHGSLNERQLKVIKRMMRAGPKGFEGGMSAKKYMSITDTSKATATRDLQQLLAMEALKQIGAGRSVRYELNFY